MSPGKRSYERASLSSPVLGNYEEHHLWYFKSSFLSTGTVQAILFDRWPPVFCQGKVMKTFLPPLRHTLHRAHTTSSNIGCNQIAPHGFRYISTRHSQCFPTSLHTIALLENDKSVYRTHQDKKMEDGVGSVLQ